MWLLSDPPLSVIYQGLDRSVHDEEIQCLSGVSVGACKLSLLCHLATFLRIASVPVHSSFPCTLFSSSALCVARPIYLLWLSITRSKNDSQSRTYNLCVIKGVENTSCLRIYAQAHIHIQSAIAQPPAKPACMLQYPSRARSLYQTSRGILNLAKAAATSLK